MAKLSIQNWIQNIQNNDERYMCLLHVEKFSNDVNSYDELIQSMQKPSDFENINDYVLYCDNILNKLHEEKVNEHIKLAKELDLLLDEFHLFLKTPSEQILSKYIQYLKDSNNDKKHHGRRLN